MKDTRYIAVKSASRTNDDILGGDIKPIYPRLRPASIRSIAHPTALDQLP